MATEQELRERERKTKEEIADKDRAQREAASKRSAVASIISKAVPSIKLPINDPSWYTRLMGNPKVDTGISTFTTGDCVDADLTDTINLGNTPTDEANASNPSVIWIPWISTIGPQGRAAVLSDGTIQMSVNNILDATILRFKSQLDKRNSRTSTYSEDTVARYFIGAIDGLYVPMKRLKTALDVYTYVNPFYPEVAQKMITALGFRYASMDQSIAEWRDAYNLLSNKINLTIPVPKDLAILDRKLFMSGTIIRDSDADQARYIVISPAFLCTVEDSDAITYKPVYYENTVAQFKNYILLNLKRLGKGATWKPFIRDLRGGMKDDQFFSMPEDESQVTTEISVVSEVLGQLHNLDTMIADDQACNFIVWSSFDVRGTIAGELYQGIGGKSSYTAWESAMLGDVGPVGPFCFHAYRNSDNFDYNMVTPANIKQPLAKFVRGSVISGTAGEVVWHCNHILNQYDDFSNDGVLVNTRLMHDKHLLLCGQGASMINKLYSEYGNSVTVPNSAPLYYYEVLDTIGTEFIPCIINIQVKAFDYNATQLPTTFNQLLASGGVMSQNYYNNAFYQDASADHLCVWYNYQFGLLGQSNVQVEYLAFKAERDRLISGMDWRPLLTRAYLTNYTGSGATYTLCRSTDGELDRYTSIAYVDLLKLHNQCVSSLFSIDPSLVLPPLS